MSWSLKSRGEPDIGLASRVVTAVSVDGYRIRSKMCLRFCRRQTNESSEAMLDSWENAYARVFGGVVSGGIVPFEEGELVSQLRARLDPKGSVVEVIQFLSLHVVGVVSPSGMFSAPPVSGQQWKPTVPPQSSQYPARSMTPSPGVQRATAAPAGPARSMTPSPGVQRATAAPARSMTPSPEVQRATAAPPPSTTLPSGPRLHRTTGAPRPSSHDHPTVLMASPSGSRKVAVPPPPLPERHPSGFRTIAMVSPAAGARPQESARWARVVAGLGPGAAVDEVAAAMVPHIQDCMVRLALGALAAAESPGFRRVGAFVEGVPSVPMAPLRRESAAAVLCMTLAALEGARIPSATAAQIVQSLGRQVVSGDGLPVADLSRYLASRAPAAELSAASAAILPGAIEGLVRAVLEPLTAHLQSELLGLAVAIQRRCARRRSG